MSSRLPVRTEPRTATDREIERLNSARGHTHGRAYEPAEKVVRRIRSQKSAGSARLASWVRHPDERVPLAIIRREADENDSWWAGRGGRELGLDLIDRAVDEAEREGVVWTPLLDALAHHGIDPWPSRNYDNRWLEAVALPNATEQLAGLDAVLATIDDPRDLDVLLDFDFEDVWKKVLLHPALDAEHVDHILDVRPKFGETMAGNKHLSEALQHRMVHRALDTLETLLARDRVLRDHRGLDADEEALLPGGRGWLEARGSTVRKVGGYAADTIRALWRGYRTRLDEEVRARLVALAPDLDADHHPDAHGRPENIACDLITRIVRADALIARADAPAGRLVDSLDVDTLERLHEKIAPNPGSLILVAATSSTEAMWMRALEQTPRHSPVLSRPSFYVTFVHHDRALEHPRVWQAILSSTCVDLFETALRDQPGERVDAMRERLYEIVDEDLDVNLERYGRPAYGAAQLLLDAFVEDEDDLRRYYRATRHGTRWSKLLLRRDVMTPRVAAEILEDTGSREVRKEALEEARLRTAPEVREVLADTVDPELLRRLLTDARGEEFVRFWYRLADKEPDRARAIFLQADLGQLGGMSSEQLVLLLRSDDREVRLKAMLALGEHHPDHDAAPAYRPPTR